MVAQPAQQRQQVDAALDALAHAGLAVAADSTLVDALARIADAAARAADADVALVRVLEQMGGELTARAVAAAPAVAAELDGTHLPADAVPVELVGLDGVPEPVRRAAARVGAAGVHVVPVDLGGRVLATVELYRAQPFSSDEQRLGLLVAGQVALALRAFGVDGGDVPSIGAPAVELAAEALAIGADAERAADEVTRLAAVLTGAAGALLWEQGRGDELELAASHGLPEPLGDLTGARTLAARALSAPGPLEVERDELLPAGTVAAAALPLGEPAVGVLQLLFADEAAPAEPELAALATFAIRAAHALRAGARTRELADELVRTRALLAVVGQATARLSLAHTLETAVDRVAELLDVDQLAVYLRQGERLLPAAGRGLAGPHVRVAERLLELALGPLRGRGVVVFESVAAQPLLGAAADAAGEAGIEAAFAVPLVAQEETIGLLAVYPRRRRRLGENDVSLLAALAAQLAVAVQNAKLHEHAKELSEERERALASERQASRQLRALYEISRSFAQSLSLTATLDAVTRTAVDVLDVDAAVIRMPDDRREQLETRALHVADPTVAEAARVLLGPPQPFGAQPVQRLFRDRVPFRFDDENVSQLGGALAPFLSRGWTAAAVPVATPAETIAALSLFSFRPAEPITDDMIARAEAIAGQAALAIDNARLYQQQKQFADTMQRSLLPRSRPVVAGLDVGAVYESAARVEVGGDVYDFLELADGRLAVVLGDVTGHGIEATADMAMAKFVFRSLAREHPEPAEFLAFANDVVVGEIAPGKFITMAYVTVDGDSGAVACAAAGHPPPRVLRRDGSVDGLDATGLVLGVDAGQDYEQVRAELPRGGAVVLYTDGVIEARRAGELYGIERLDELLAANASLPADTLARAVVEDCRAFAGGELPDDCAVVVIKRV